MPLQHRPGKGASPCLVRAFGGLPSPPTAAGAASKREAPGGGRAFRKAQRAVRAQRRRHHWRLADRLSLPHVINIGPFPVEGMTAADLQQKMKALVAKRQELLRLNDDTGALHADAMLRAAARALAQARQTAHKK